MSGYLFVYFAGEQTDQEQIYFSVSQDGLHWQDLNDGQPVLVSTVGEQGARDPFIVKDDRCGKYYLLATDLKISYGEDWQRAKTRGSRDLLVWESSDLLHWSEVRACPVGLPEAGCVWAPEAIYDQEKEAFLVFWASNVQEAGDQQRKMRIYASYTKDFVDFSPTFKYIERPNDIIDTTIVYVQNHYYRFSKNETTKTIELEKGATLAADAFTTLEVPLLKDFYGLEGPECYQLPSGQWCLIADQFATNQGYLPMLIADWDKGQLQVFPTTAYDLGQGKKRHGGVIAITNDEYHALIANFK